MNKKISKTVERAREIFKAGAVIITAADIKDGVMERVQLYFESEGQAVMDLVSKDDLVQNWPDEGVYAFNTDGIFRKVTMIEGAEDMFFRTNDLCEEKDDFGPLPGVAFMEAMEEISQLKV